MARAGPSGRTSVVSAPFGLSVRPFVLPVGWILRSSLWRLAGFLTLFSHTVFRVMCVRAYPVLCNMGTRTRHRLLVTYRVTSFLESGYILFSIYCHDLCLWLWTGYGLDIGFTDTLLHTTRNYSNYSAIANLHNHISPQHPLGVFPACLVFNSRSLWKASNSGDSSSFVLASLLSGEYPTTKLSTVNSTIAPSPLSLPCRAQLNCQSLNWLGLGLKATSHQPPSLLFTARLSTNNWQLNWST
jgi:hypothetical protein